MTINKWLLFEHSESVIAAFRIHLMNSQLKNKFVRYVWTSSHSSSFCKTNMCFNSSIVDTCLCIPLLCLAHPSKIMFYSCLNKYFRKQDGLPLMSFKVMLNGRLIRIPTAIITNCPIFFINKLLFLFMPAPRILFADN
jgi:hypothetical protein